jgi:arginine/lysine/ornithine decarboxylase
MLLYSASPGDTVILPRNAHLSFFSGFVLADLHPVYVPLTAVEDGYAFAPEEGFLQAMERHPNARAIVVTRPDYFGGMICLDRIAESAHQKGMRLLVDEAHGAHLNWLEGAVTAASCGADLWVQSAHKTLPCLTAGALLHLKKGEDEKRARRMLRLVQTSSPAFYLMQSLDDARAWMESNGASALRRLAGNLQELRCELEPLGYHDGHAVLSKLPMTFDPTRLVISAPQGGYSLAKSLGAQGIDVEMADDRHIVCILTVMDEKKTLSCLLSALARIPPSPALNEGSAKFAAYPIPRQAMDPRKAALSKQEQVEFIHAAGRISGTSVGLYPPGIPLAAPGEILEPEILSLLQSAPKERRFGLCDGQLLCVAES